VSEPASNDLVTLDPAQPIWERFFSVAPLILVGSRDPDGGYNLAPKHMATPLGWQNYYGFVCSPTHRTYRNIAEFRQFTVSFPRPEQVVEASFAAAPRWEDCSKPGLQVIHTLPARSMDSVLVAGCAAYLECQLDRFVEGLGENSLVVGRVLAAHVTSEALRTPDRDDNDLVQQAPLLAYVSPGRFARIDRSWGFPFPAGFAR
jgi:flavin reductase (DIM6/NTAB) family NADH-FMN oxidoreductase RutF